MAKVFNTAVSIPKTYYRAIGEMIARTALFETQLMDAIAEIIPIREKKMKRVVLMNMSVKPKFGVLDALVKNWITHAALRKELLFIIKHGRQLVNFRHYLAHGIWAYDKNPRKPYLLFIPESKDVFLPKHMQLTSKEIEGAAKAMLHLTERLNAATRALHALRAP